ncbi:aspartate--tRNA ligase [Candidatus Solincola tengchongensis]|uniref:aspartate--tRNA ligase n=1 Tax=Candidatus Solincola tengchongensis TaxID=2900693 RepID=UPI002579A027|nr:aspartate--tRNA ligase [Candidatus Solincola tengchongensis]
MKDGGWEKRTHYCGTLRTSDVGREVVLNGWVQTRRDHGGVIFLDLRDISGLVQVVCNPEVSPEAHAAARQVRSEYVLSCRGVVRARPEDSVNPRLPTGEVEVMAEKVTVINSSLTPPFEIEPGSGVEETLRLRYRYLDLRRPDMQEALLLRSRVTQEVRNFLISRNFLEIETPILTKSTPEGARDFVVPSRLQPGKFYALPQSPQLFKQLLMVAGFDRYFQIARCFRDEDLRADRQPEFTQIDLEMSFVEPEDVMSLMDEMFAHLFRSVLGVELPVPFPRLTWREAMERYGTDRPDRRWGMEMQDYSRLFRETDFRVFRSALEKGGRVRGFKVAGMRSPARRELDGLVDEARRLGAGGLVWMVRDGEGLKSPAAKFLSLPETEGVVRAAGLEEGEVLLLAAGGEELNAVLSGLRSYCAQRYAPRPDERFSFTWVTDFPLFEWDEEERRYKSNHHPFTAPSAGCLEYLEERPLEATSDSYDLVLNGVELGGGSIRIHDPELQRRVFGILGLSEEEAAEKFGFLLEAFRYGPPPHGGIAFGLDRLVMIMAGRESIREVIAFPKTQSGSDPLTGAPDVVYPEQLRELRLRPI